MQSKYAVTEKTFMDVYRHPWNYAIRPFRIAGNLYYVGNTSVGAHLVDSGDGLILLDTTFPQTYSLLVNSIWELGFSIYDIKYILHSHGHFDHIGGTQELSNLTKAKTFLGAKDARMFRERPELALREDCPYSYVELFTPDVELEDGQRITLGSAEIRAVSTPGHSPGVMSYLIRVEDGKNEYTAAMHGGAGFNTLNRPFFEKFGLDGDAVRADFINGVTRLEAESVDITLGNHPNQNNTAEKRRSMLENPSGPNPFIDTAEWGRFLSDIKRRFAVMLEEEAAGIF
jgi:metallo-beta-lactamase class B